LNLDKVIKHNVVKYVKYKKEEHINFKMRIKIINILSKKQFIDKSRKDATKNKSNLDFA